MTAKDILKQHITVYSGWVSCNVKTGETKNLPDEYKFTPDELQTFCEQLLLEYDESGFDDPALASDEFYADGREHFLTELFKP